MKKLLLILTLLFHSTLSEAATYYISQSAGNDANPGTIGSPFKTADAVNGNNFLSCGDRVLLKAGDTWTGTEAIYFGTIDSNCATSSNPIIFDRYGDGVNPIIEGNSAYGGSWTNDSGAIYYASVSWSPVGTVAVDSSSVIWETDTKADMEAGTWYFDDAADRVYVWLADGSDPTGHSIVIGRYPTSEAGLLNPTQNGTGSRNNENYLFRNIEVRYSNWYGTLVTSPNIKYEGVSLKFCARDGFIASTYGAWDGSYASIINCHIAYNVSKGTGYGQGVTFNSPYGRIERSLIEYNGMAGIDFLNYSSTNTDASYCIAKNNTIRYNAQWKGRTGLGNFDPGIYCDGCQDSLIYGNDVSFNGKSNGTNTSAGVKVYSENPSQRSAKNIYVINNAIYSNSYAEFHYDTSNVSAVSASWFIGNTAVRGELASVTAIIDINSNDSLKSYYNIFSYGSPPIYSNASSIPRITADYNFIYNGGTSAYYDGANRTLAYIKSNYSIETNSSASDALLVDINSDATIDTHLQAGSPALNFSDGSQWANLPTWVKNEIGASQPRGYVLASGAKDSGASKANGYHFASGQTIASGVTLSKVTVS